MRTAVAFINPVIFVMAASLAGQGTTVAMAVGFSLMAITFMNFLPDLIEVLREF